ncbi:glycosyltransferase family 2 protein [Thermocoleostomius sinensis]|jgi:hypothetical protein|uniref:Glycosyltransferase family 2 protein n=1 Tax=Thermocoleostomius sinensis A174 TaxID=2016057 RepID=A0A9E9CA59_9CYAN|nr:glycosyltransferase family 2 protein [Thermocoleostomius sinensis]WAL58535.1 glycosyltransferase family 2 protein [Thermocoleostomius sinensis A174]
MTKLTPLQVPVVLIIFKRPHTTQQVLNAIRIVCPKKLVVIADGPRLDREGEAEACARTRAVIDQVDWNCEVIKHYSEINLGCGVRPATGLDWVFEQFEDAIILEDDCLPDPTFFYFCEELLEKYRHESKIMSICGSRFVPSTTPFSYYFSHYVSCWGWATWRRAWQHFDFEIGQWSKLRESAWLEQYLQNQKVADCWSQRFQSVYRSGQNHIWDYQWQFACWLNKSLSIRPNVNLISNIGIGADSTHTLQNSSGAKTRKLEAMSFPLRHPGIVDRDIQADLLVEKECFTRPSFLTRAYQKLYRLLA